MTYHSKTEDKSIYIRKAAIIALVGNAFLAIFKITAGIISQSGALIGDGIDSSTDVIISVMTLVIVGYISKPADAKHPWGHRRAETIATAFLSFVLFFAGAQLIIDSISKLIADVHTTHLSSLAIIAASISVIGKLLLAWSQQVLGKRADSAIIKANAKNMAGDVLISIGVLTGFAITHLTGAAHADSVVAILIGCWIIKTAIGIFINTNLELMDGSGNINSYSIIVDAVNSIDGAYHPHRARMRNISGFWDISFDINVNPKLSVSDAHEIASKVENEIKKRLENIYDIMIHVEPSGDNAAEAFGLSENEMNNGKSDLHK